MLDARLDLSQASIKIPERFHHVRYSHGRYPGAQIKPKEEKGVVSFM